MNGIIYKGQIKYINTLRRPTGDGLERLEEFAIENKVPIIHWNAGDFLEMMIKINKPKSVLEIGTAIGYSAIRIARNLQEDAFLDTIEYSKDNIPKAVKNIEDYGFSDKIKVYQGDARIVLKDFNKQYDFIFLDADKCYYSALFEMVLPLLKTGGILFVDNLLLKGKVAKVTSKMKNKACALVKDFNTLFLNTESLDSTIYPIGDGVGVGIKLKD